MSNVTLCSSLRLCAFACGIAENEDREKPGKAERTISALTLPGEKQYVGEKLISLDRMQQPLTDIRSFFTSHRNVLLILVIASAGLLLVHGRAITRFLQGEDPLVQIYIDDFRTQDQRVRKDAVEFTGAWQGFDKGLLLASGEEGSITYRFSKAPEEVPVYLRLWFRRIGGIENSLTCVAGEKTFRLKNTDFHGQRVYLTRTVADSGSFDLTLKAVIDPDVRRIPAPLLSKIEVHIFSPQAARLVRIPSLLALLLLPFLCYALLQRFSRRDDLSLVIALVIYGGALLASRLAGGVLAYLNWVYVALLVFLWVDVLRRREYDRARNALFAFTVFAIVLLAFCVRWNLMVEKAGHLLDPDARGYYAIATTSPGLFQSACDIPPYVREPFFIWAIRIFYIFTPSTETSLRFFTLLLSLGALVAGAYFGRAICNAFVGLVVAFLMAINSNLIFMSVRGLRLELYMLVILAFAACLMFLRPKTVRRFSLLGITTGILHLSRITSLSFTIFLLPLLGVIKRWKATQVMLALGIGLLLLTPHLVFNYFYNDSGDPFFSGNIHARFYRNIEFQGQQGFPSVDAVRANPYTGPPITTFQYLFGLHTIPEVVYASLRGFVRIFFTAYAKGILLEGNVVLFALYLVGLVSLLCSPSRMLLLIMFFVEMPILFIAGKAVDWRLVAHIAPFVYCCVGMGFYTVARGWWQLIARGRRQQAD